MKNNKPIQWINSALSEIVSLEDKKGKLILKKCGRECAKSHELLSEVKEIRSTIADKNDFDLLLKTYKEKVYNNTSCLYKDGDVIYLEYHECGCPMVKEGVDNAFLCNCTIGYTKEIYETLFGKPVKVKLLKSILKGDKICKQAISIIA